MGRQNTASLKKVILSKRRDGLNVINRWEAVKWGGGGKKFFWGSVQSDGERRKEKYLAGTVFHILGM